MFRGRDCSEAQRHDLDLTSLAGPLMWDKNLKYVVDAA